MKKPKLIVLVGMPGAGKSYCVDYLKAKGWPSVYFGGITIDEVKRRGLEVNEVNEKMVREEIRSTEGKDAYAKRILKQAETLAEQGNEKVIVDGLYSWSEYRVFKEKYGADALIIAITAPRKLRHQRLANRAVRPLNEEQVTSREYAEIENIEKGGPIANADYTITNNSTTEKLENDIEEILKQESI